MLYINFNVPLNKDGNNANISYNYAKAIEYLRRNQYIEKGGYHRLVNNANPSDDIYNAYYCYIPLGHHISFNLRIKTNNCGSIDILDDDWCQPYDFQNMENGEISESVQKQVYDIMENLKKLEIIADWNYGDYI